MKKGKEQEFVAVWKSFADWSMDTQPGSLHVELMEDEEDASHFVTIGEWKDKESIEAWRRAPEFMSFMKKYRELCDRFSVRSFKTLVAAGREQVVR